MKESTIVFCFFLYGDNVEKVHVKILNSSVMTSDLLFESCLLYFLSCSHSS